MKTKPFIHAMRIVLFAWSIAATGRSLAQHSLPQHAGAIAGEFEVTHSGAAQYILPIQIPPGTGGMAPQLSLAYSSTAGNGLLGQGMNLSGLSSIRRSPATLAQDGYKGAVNFDNRDRLTLDGQRLILTQGEYGTYPQAYHTELENWHRITAAGPAQNGPASFEVVAPNGHRRTYGSDSSSQVWDSEGKGIRIWLIDQEEDLHGNTITYHYSQNKAHGSYRLDEIRYTGNAKLGLLPQRKVNLLYATDRPDQVDFYLGGGKIRKDDRLSAIETYVNDQKILAYTFEYAKSQTTGNSLLTQITLCEASGRCLPPTTITWSQEMAVKLEAAQPLSLPSKKYNPYLIPLDANGDGLQDFVRFYNNSGVMAKADLYLSNGETFTRTKPLNLSWGGGSRLQLMPGDINGDGMTDLVCVLNSPDDPFSARIFLSHGEGFHEDSIVFTSKNVRYGRGRAMLMDANGDGRQDLIYDFVSDETPMTVHRFLSNGNGFADAGPQIFHELKMPGSIDQLDHNGDGLIDLVYSRNTPDDALQVWILQSSPQEFKLLPKQELLPKGGGGLFYVDHNGDGNTDLVYVPLKGEVNTTISFHVFFSTGTKFTQGTITKTDQKINYFRRFLTADLNGDSWTDIIYAEPGHLHTYVSNGNGFTFHGSYESKEGGIVPMDINGDGKSDLLYGSGRDRNPFFTQHSAPRNTDLVTRVSNGIGGEWEIRYRPLTDRDIFSRSASPNSHQVAATPLLVSGVNRGTTFENGSFSPSSQFSPLPSISADFPTYMVASYTMTDGLGTRYGFGFKYANARVDLEGRGWLGFQTQSVCDSSLNLLTEHHFSQTFPRNSMVDSVLYKRASDGQVLKKYLYQYKTGTPVIGNEKVQTVQKTQFLRTYMDGGKAVVTTSMDYEYDAFGNHTLVAYRGDLSKPDRVLYTRQTWLNDENKWTLSYLQEKKQSGDAAGNQVLLWEKWDYDSENRNIKSHSQYDDQQKKWLGANFLYDGFGNQTHAIDLVTRDTSATSYDAQFHTFVTQTVSPPNSQGKKWVERFQYEPGFGKKIEHTDLNGYQHLYAYDGLGRLVKYSGPNPEGGKSATFTYRTVQRKLRPTAGFEIRTTDALSWDGKLTGEIVKILDGLKREAGEQILGKGGLPTVVSNQRLNSQGHPTRKEYPHFENEADVQYTSISHDPLGRIVRMVEPYGANDSTVTESAYSGPIVSITKAVGTSSERKCLEAFEYLNERKVLAYRVAENGEKTTFQNDLLGRMVQATDPVGLTTETVYSTVNRIVRDNAPGLGSRSYMYDDQARTITRTDAINQSIVYQHDAHGRIIEKRLGKGEKVEFRYDLETRKNGMGKLGEVILQTGDSYSYDYDLNGNQDSIRMHVDGNTYSIGYAHGPGNQLHSVNFMDNSSYEYTYQDGDILSHVSSGEEKMVNFSDYSPYHKAQNIGFKNGVSQKIKYDAQGKITSSEIDLPNSTEDHQQSYHYDRLHRIDSIIDSESRNHSQRFGYDPVGRLIMAQGAYGSKRYTYDAAGNLLHKDSLDLSYNRYQVTLGKVKGQEIFHAAYDAVGNCTLKVWKGDTTRFKFDVENRLTGVEGNGQLIYTFAYNANGERIKKVDILKGITTVYLSPEFEITLKKGVSVRQTKNLRCQGALLLSQTTQTSSSQDQVELPPPGIQFYNVDHLGSVSFITDGKGKLVNRVRYAPYGSMLSDGGDEFEGRYSYTGQENDRLSGLYYFSSRYYDPSIGCFLTSDTRLGGPANRSGVFNRYAYVLNDPINFSDPSGHSIWSAIGGFFIGAAEVAAGIAIDVASGGALSELGDGFINAGAGAMIYSVTHGKDFNWAHFGEEDGANFVGGLVGAMGEFAIVKGLGEGAEALASTVGGIVTDVTSQLTTDALEQKKVSWRGMVTSVALGAAGGYAIHKFGDIAMDKLVSKAEAKMEKSIEHGVAKEKSWTCNKKADG